MPAGSARIRAARACDVADAQARQSCPRHARQHDPPASQRDSRLRADRPRNVALFRQPDAVTAQEPPVVAKRPVLVTQRRGVMLPTCPAVELITVSRRSEHAAEAASRSLDEEVRLLAVCVAWKAFIELNGVEHRAADECARREERRFDRLGRKYAVLIHRRWS